MSTAEAPRGQFPRVIRPDLLWTGGTLDFPYGDELVYGHFCTYLIKGSQKSLLVDTGHPIHWPQLERDVEQFLDGRPLDYVFPTHCELPHNGLFGDWLRKYPEAVGVGSLADYPLYFPDLADRMLSVQPGEALDLGDRQFLFVPPVWRDLADTLWGFDTKARTLYASDAFAYVRYHHEGQCDLMISEAPLPDLKMIQFFNERALLWTRYTDPEMTFRDMDRLLDRLKPELIAPGHGAIVDNYADMVPLAKRGMNNTRNDIVPDEARKMRAM